MQKKTRNTTAKQAILELISTADQALSHIEIQQKLNNLCDRVTIYRVLSRLVEEQKIHKIINTDGVVNYAACHSCSHQEHQQESHNHIHFSCTVCKSVTCLEGIVPTFQLPVDYELQEINFTVAGICPKCKRTV
ncbi:MAG: Fur family transcriptional regulator [Crocinitomicaceae bacterium]|jgi:Fur family transcriptional regulator, ferric uptake regulator|nr:Fur family transcriptional regulator [Crocinitomicaceae bacterium]